MVWFQEKPQMLQYELSRLAAIGAQVNVDQNALDADKVVLSVKYKIDNNELEFQCEFPPAYPYFPPEISCRNFPEGRHLEPFGKTLCTFADKNNSWNIAEDTLAGLFENQITEIYRIHKDSSRVSEHEDALEGYQPSGQLVTEPYSVVVLTSDIPQLSGRGTGFIHVNFINRIRLFNDSEAEPFSGCLTTAFDSEGMLAFEDKTDYYQRFKTKLPIRWIKLPTPLASVDPSGIFHQVVSVYPDLQTPSYVRLKKTNIDIIAVCFDEESTRGNFEQNWLFLIRRSYKIKKVVREQFTLVKSDYLHPTQLLARTPRLVGLVDKTVTIIGLGALGSQVAFQLARAGVKKLILIDRDHLQLGNLSRWIAGLPYIGMPKVQAVAQVLHSNFIGLQIEVLNCDVGGFSKIPTQNGTVVDIDTFLRDSIVAKSDLVIDCSAMLNVNQYISNLSKSKNTDFIWCSATNGGWGGIVGRSPASFETDVWMQYNLEHSQRSIATEPSDFIQPKGCFHPTFTGTGVDLDSISNMASRMAISMLQGEKYGVLDCDVYILNQWIDESPIAPEWEGIKYCER